MWPLFLSETGVTSVAQAFIELFSRSSRRGISSESWGAWRGNEDKIYNLSRHCPPLACCQVLIEKSQQASVWYEKTKRKICWNITFYCHKRIQVGPVGTYKIFRAFCALDMAVSPCR